MASGVARHEKRKACAFFMAGEANGKSPTNKESVCLFQGAEPGANWNSPIKDFGGFIQTPQEVTIRIFCCLRRISHHRDNDATTSRLSTSLPPHRWEQVGAQQPITAQPPLPPAGIPSACPLSSRTVESQRRLPMFYQFSRWSSQSRRWISFSRSSGWTPYTPSQ